MDAETVSHLDVGGLARALPTITGDPPLVAAAEVLRAAVAANIILLSVASGGGDDSGSPSMAAYRRWSGILIAAPVDAAWWVEYAPTTAGGLMAALARTPGSESKTGEGGDGGE